MFAVGAASVGVAVNAGAAGAGLAEANCEGERGQTRCAELEVTKVVTGKAAPGTTFAIVVDCVRPENGDGVLPPPDR
jgi:hypothetical protein